MAEGHQRGRKPTEDEQWKLRFAINNNDVTTVTEMITKKLIDVDADISTGWGSSLHYATYFNKIDIVKKLVKLGANIYLTNDYNDTPLDDAVRRNSIDIVHFFIKECNQDISKIKQRHQQKIQTMKKVKKYLDHKEKIEKVAFSLARQHGKAKVLGIKLLLFGAENVGKSCVAATLVGDPFKENDATEGADIDICNTSNWEKITNEELSQKLQTEYLCNLKEIAESKAGIAKTSVETEKKPNIFTKTVIKLFSSVKRSQPSISAKEQQVPPVEIDEIKGAKATEKKISDDKGGIDVTILDFAGQTQYHNTHSVFIRKDNIVMIVFNASQPLSKNVKVRSSTLRSDPMTNSQNIHFWMNTVHSVCRDPGDENDKASLLPVILLVATHLDLLGDSAEEAKEEIIQTLAKELEGKPYAQHLAGHREGLPNALRKYCIFLSNKHRNPEAVLQLQYAIFEISLPILSREQPLAYLKIEKVLLNLNKGVITIKEFHAITISCGFLAAMESEEFAVALEYFHHCGTILHFATIPSLKELVILSPHWLTKFFSYVLIAHPYQRIGGQEDNAFRILTEKGILLGSFLTHMLGYFKSSEKVGSREIERDQTIDLMKRFGFVAEISPKAKFLEEAKLPKEKDIFIAPSLLPDDTTNQKQIPEEKDSSVRVVYFYLPDHFLPPILFDQMVTKCIDRNEFKRETILWLRKGKVMMSLSQGQRYCISLCEEKYCIQLSFVLLPGGRHLAEHRRELLQYFQSNLEVVMEDFMSATSQPVAFIPCCYCSQLHVELELLLKGEQQDCPENIHPIPKQYYCDLITDQGNPNLSATAQLTTDIPDTDTVTHALPSQLTTSDTSATEKASAHTQQSSTDVDISDKDKFDCSTALKNIQENYDEIIHLPVNSMLRKLYSKGVITLEDKERIKANPVESDRMEYFLDHSIIKSLTVHVPIKLKGFLEVMEESGDSTLISMAKKLGGSKAIPKTN